MKFELNYNPIDGLWRVTEAGCPTGICFGGAFETEEEAIESASDFLGISPEEIL